METDCLPECQADGQSECSPGCTWDCIVVGGGAAGFFSAVTLQRIAPRSRVLLIERTNVLLTKVRISGGGRCNVTHHCFEPKELIRHYPRGSKELLGAFHQFQPRDTVAWFQKRGVSLVREQDGRMFPSTHSSETIAQTLLQEARHVGLNVRNQVKITRIRKERDLFWLDQEEGPPLCAKKLVLATGSSREGHRWAQQLGHRIETPVPSLFTFNCPDSPLRSLSGVSVPHAKVSLVGTRFAEQGPLLITHFGFSGPAILRTSAFAARWLAEQNYQAILEIKWLPDLNEPLLLAELQQLKQQMLKKRVGSTSLLGLPQSLVEALAPDVRWQDLSRKQMVEFAGRLLRYRETIRGKTTHKEEFVTAGGVALEEVCLKSLESRVCPGLFFAGEILDIDGVTGGFNFQAAWTTGYCAAHGCAAQLQSGAGRVLQTV